MRYATLGEPRNEDSQVETCQLIFEHELRLLFIRFGEREKRDELRSPTTYLGTVFLV